MKTQGILSKELPKLTRPILIAGFDGWGNALDISTGMVAYIIRKLKARSFAKINPDEFYQYDANRPLVNIVSGTMESFTPPGGTFYAVRNDSGGNDLVLLKADEPSLSWNYFVDELFSLSRTLGVITIITLGSMYDNVLHTDRIISGIASTKDLLIRLKQKNVIPVSYHGPSAIHSIIQAEGEQRGYPCISLWCHCPYYLQNTTHFGLLSHLSAILSSLGQFAIDAEDLDASWRELQQQIEALIENSNEFKTIINEIRKEKVKGSWESLKKSTKGEKVINLTDFLKFK
ncbi:MAG: PAC2 family protein [Desulfobacterales bacterium]|nr:MAG: PAC2 family protein [Desulfobacterales bacterium]